VLRRSGLALILTFILTGVAGTAHAQTSSHQELQAAYIFNFAKYVRWPAMAQADTFVIGVHGGQEIMKFLEKAFLGKRIGGRSTGLKMITTPDDMLSCNIIYVPESGSRNLKDLITTTKGKSILIVTEEDLIRKGAPISFVIVEERLKFKLNKRTLMEAGLTASEGLLKLAILQ
jgi:hypothetical protein